MYSINDLSAAEAGSLYSHVPELRSYAFKFWLKSLLRDPDGGHTHASAHTHAANADLLPCALQFVQKRAHLSSSCATKWMPECDSPCRSANYSQ